MKVQSVQTGADFRLSAVLWTSGGVTTVGEIVVGQSSSLQFFLRNLQLFLLL